MPGAKLTTQIDQDASAAENELRFAIGESSLGPILVASSDKGICAILFGSDSDALVPELRKGF